jgi:hypothetical protein
MDERLAGPSDHAFVSYDDENNLYYGFETTEEDRPAVTSKDDSDEEV